MEENKLPGNPSLKKDLIKVTLLTVLIGVAMAGLKIIDNQSGAISEFASKIMSYVVR